MGAKQNNHKDLTCSGLAALKMPLGTVLTDAITIGRSGRAWHLNLVASREKISRTYPSGIKTESFDDIVVRQTCEFLRQHAPDTYRALYSQLLEIKRLEPGTDPKDSFTIRRLARLGVEPAVKRGEPALKLIEEGGRRAPFQFTVPKIDHDHWARPLHHNAGNYTSEKSGDPKELANFEGPSDIKAIRKYLKRYHTLSEDVSGRNLWRATHEAGFTAPYDTCMAICVGEARLPSHFLSLVHYGIGLQFMYELSFQWKRGKNPESVSPLLIDSFKDAFRALARLYREDFCV